MSSPTTIGRSSYCGPKTGHHGSILPSLKLNFSGRFPQDRLRFRPCGRALTDGHRRRVEGFDMAKRSAGLLIFRRTEAELQVLLVHPGGPFWARKDTGAWSIPKGLVDDGEDELAAAQREVEEEIGTKVHGRFERLGEYKQRGGKIVIAWSIEADIDIDPDSDHQQYLHAGMAAPVRPDERVSRSGSRRLVQSGRSRRQNPGRSKTHFVGLRERS